MNHNPSSSRDRAAVALTSTLKGVFIAGALGVASPALADQAGNPNDKNEKGYSCGQNQADDHDSQTGSPCKDKGVPAPLVAAGFPALLVLGGGYIAVRKRRRDCSAKE